MTIPIWESHSQNTIDGTSLVVTKPTGVVEGWYMIANGNHSTGGANALDGANPAGWTQLFVGNNGDENIGVWIKKATGSEPTDYTFTWTTSNACIITIDAFSGVHGTLATAVHKEHYNVQTAADTFIENTVTTTLTDCLLWGVASRDDTAANTVTWTGTGTPTEKFDFDGNSFLLQSGAHQAAASAQAYTQRATYSAGSLRNCMSLIALAPPAAAGGDILVMWPSTNASIPSGWARETAMDALYPKGTANGVDPGGTGGALTHSHTTTAHDHTTAHVHTVPNSSAAADSTNRDTGTTNPPLAHAHNTNPNTVNPTTALATATPSTDSVNHEPSYFVVIFIKPTGAFAGVPASGVVIWDEAAGAPTNWNLCDGGGGRPDMRNRWAKGAAAAGDGGGTGGGTTHTHTIASHDHTTPYAHGHPDVTSSANSTAATTGSIAGGTAGTATQTHTHPLTIVSASPVITGNTDAAASSDHQPPYWAEAFIQNNTGGNSWPDLIIALWTGTLATIPTDWHLCDGTVSTPDLRSLFVKGANTLGGIGGSGGSLTHGATHTTTGHTHAVASHVHGVTAGTGAGENRTAGATAAPTTAHTHASWSDTGAASFTSSSTAPTVNNYTDTQPPFKTVAFIQWQAPAVTDKVPLNRRTTYRESTSRRSAAYTR
jgi:hypothetical protein